MRGSRVRLGHFLMPPSNPLGWRIKLKDSIVSPQEHAIQSTRIRREVFTILSEDQSFDQSIDNRVFDTGCISAALTIGGFTALKLALFIAG